MKVIVSFCLLLASTAWAGDIVHFTPETSGFASELVIRNASLNAAQVTLKFGTGDKQDQLVVTLNGNETRVLDGHAFSAWPSHMRYETDGLVNVAVRYRLAEGGGNAVTVSGVDAPAKVYRYGYLDPADFWQGLAVVNRGERSAEVAIRQYSGSGEMLYDTVLTTELAPDDKLLSVVSELPLRTDAQSYLEVVSNQPIASTMLFGNDPKSPAPVMSTAQPEKVYSDQIVANISGGFLGVDQTVVIDAGRLQTGSSLVEVVDAAALQNELVELGIASLQVNNTFDNCCDIFVYHLEYVDGSTRNSITFNERALWEQDANAVKASKVVQRIFELASELTGETFTGVPVSSAN